MTIRLVEAELTSGFAGLGTGENKKTMPSDEHDNVIYMDMMNKLDFDVIRSLGVAKVPEDISRNNTEGFGNPH